MLSLLQVGGKKITLGSESIKTGQLIWCRLTIQWKFASLEGLVQFLSEFRHEVIPLFSHSGITLLSH